MNTQTIDTTTSTLDTPTSSPCCGPQDSEASRPTGIVSRVTVWLDRFPSASRGMFSLLDQAVVSATSFATAIIINRVCAPNEVGLYYLTITIVLVALGIHEHVIAAPYTIYSRRYQDTARAAYAGSVWVHHALITALAVILLLVTIAGLSFAGVVPLRPALWALVAAGPLLLLREWIRRYAFADLDFVTALALDAVVAGVQLSGLVLLAYLGLLTIFNIFLTMGLACGLASLGWYRLRPPRVTFERSRFASDWRGNWAFGRWALQGYLVHNTVPYVMVWVVGAAAGTAAAGLLGACATVIGMTTLLLTGVDRFLTPKAAEAFVEGGSAALRSVLLRGLAFLLCALVPFFILVLATGPLLATLAYGDGFEHAGPILATLAAVNLTTTVGMCTGIGLWAIDRPRANFLADLCGMVVTILSAFLLVAPLGAWGAALATLAGSSVAACVRSATLLRLLSAARLEEARLAAVRKEAP